MRRRTLTIRRSRSTTTTRRTKRTKTRTVRTKTRTIRTRSLTTGKKTLTLERSRAEKKEFLHFIFENNLISINKHAVKFLSQIYATHITLYNDHDREVVGMVCLHYIWGEIRFGIFATPWGLCVVHPDE